MFFLKSLCFVPFLSSLVAAIPVPEPSSVHAKSAPCASFSPGSILLKPSTSPFLVCNFAPNDISFIYQTDGNFVVYNGNSGTQVAVWNSGTYGQNCASNNCTLAFQADGNLVEYYNRKPMFAANTGANIGKQLYFQNTAPYMYITNSAGQVAWQT